MAAFEAHPDVPVAQALLAVESVQQRLRCSCNNLRDSQEHNSTLNSLASVEQQSLLRFRVYSVPATWSVFEIRISQVKVVQLLKDGWRHVYITLDQSPGRSVSSVPQQLTRYPTSQTRRYADDVFVLALLWARVNAASCEACNMRTCWWIPEGGQRVAD